jgi:hypothetical protein
MHMRTEYAMQQALAVLGALLLSSALPACGNDDTRTDAGGDDGQVRADAGSTTPDVSDDPGTPADTGTSPGPETGMPDPDTDPDPDTSMPRDVSSDEDARGGQMEDAGSPGDTSSETGVDAEEVELALTSITPDRGPVEGGTQFVLEGRGLTRETVVYFGSRKAQANLVNDRLVGQTPRGASAGSVTVKALDPTTGDDTLTDGFTYTTTLQFDSAAPTRLPTSGGTTVTIEGSGFDAETRVSFDGTSARRHERVDDETLRVVAPSNSPGPADVRLTNRDSTTVAERAVTYFQALELDRVRPAAGSMAGGTKVTLHGAGFTSKMTVTFGNSQAQILSVGSQGQKATVSTPAVDSSGLVDVGLSTSKGGATLLEDAFYYRNKASAFELVDVDPAVARRSGQVEVELRGTGLDDSNLTVTFGGKQATIVDRGPGHATVTIPSHAPGMVDVTASTDAQTTSTLSNAFRYVEDLWVDKVSPSRGGTRANTQVTIRGQGFQGVESNGRVRFGGVSANFSVVSDTKITAKAPNHAAGTVDVTVERGEVEATLRDGFTYTEPLKVFGFSPVRGSVAGNTYVVVRGQGFQTGNMDVTFGSKDAKAVEVLDPHTLAARTPAQKPQAIDVNITRDGQTVTPQQQYTYFNPGARNGGTWGGPIRGAVNVSVYSKGGRPIPRAFVMLSTNPETTYKGKTDRNGRVTLSGPDVYGEQTITAIAPKYSSTTVQRVDSENITIFLNPPTSNGQPPPGPPTATFEGNITGLKKIAQPEPDEIQVAIVRTTRKSPWSSNPDPGDQNVVRSNGTYKLKSRVGDLALVAIGGLQNRSTGEFEPLMMGVKRFQFAAQGKTYKRNIDLDIPMDREMTFKLKNPPRHPNGPDTNRVVPYLDFGFEGVFGNFDIARGDSNVLRARHQPHLTGELSDVSYTLIGGTYTERPDGNDADERPDLGTPQSVAIKRNVTATQSIIQLPPLLGVARVTSPQSGARPVDGLVTFDIKSSNRPDFYFARVLTPRGRALWEIFLPGSANSFTLPDFPDFSHLPKKRRPKPYPNGTFRLSITGIRHQGVSYGNFSYSDLSTDKWEAFSVGGQRITFGR